MSYVIHWNRRLHTEALNMQEIFQPSIPGSRTKSVSKTRVGHLYYLLKLLLHITIEYRAHIPITNDFLSFQDIRDFKVACTPLHMVEKEKFSPTSNITIIGEISKSAQSIGCKTKFAQFSNVVDRGMLKISAPVLHISSPMYSLQILRSLHAMPTNRARRKVDLWRSSFSLA